jgi:CTP synthase
VGKENVLYIHLTLVPFIKTAGEVKTKPTQHSVKELRGIGIQPDILLCRSEHDLSPEIKTKIALHCNIEPEAVITARDVESIYEVPTRYHKEELDDRIVEKLNIWTRAPRLNEWEDLARKIKNPRHHVTIGIVGKYIDLRESYKSLNEALTHGGIANESHVNLEYIDSEDLQADENDPKRMRAMDVLASVDGILVPGGFGLRGIEGKILAARFARENNVPFFGICLGMQVAAIEFARNVAGKEDANSTEFEEKTTYPLIYLMREWYDPKTDTVMTRDVNTEKGGTMRLGAYPCVLKEGTLAAKAYGTKEISERHRHRYEFNNDYRDDMTENGLIFSGVSPDNNLIEIIELPDHPWFLGCQFHPEFKSKPMRPHPLFASYIKAALAYRQKRS